MLTDGLKDRNNVHRFALVFIFGHKTGQDSPAIDKDCRTIQTGNGNHAAWHIFIAAANRDQAVKPFRSDGGFDRVCNDIA